MTNKIHIFSGHFGSGKTETAVNFALCEHKMGRDVVIVDLDTVNPFFRSYDAARLLNDNGIEVIANPYAASNIDMPTVPAEVRGVFERSGATVIFDVGGDDDGAYALGQYREYFAEYGYEMHLVVNTKRPLTRTAAELLEIARRIETASGLRFTDIYNNTNLSYETARGDLFSDYCEIEKLAEEMGIPVARNCAVYPAEVPGGYEDTVFPMKICVPKPW